MTLRHTQQVFCEAVSAPAGSHRLQGAVQLIRNGGRLSPEQRLAIYRNTGRSARLGALQQIYPVCRTILGSRTFDRLAQDYAIESIPTGADLNLYGEGFARFADRAVQRITTLGEFAYLGDLARLEWRWHAVYYRDDDPAFDIGAFARRSAHADSLVPILSHSLELMASDYPVHRIWKLHREQQPPACVAGLHRTEHLCIYRQGFRPAIETISPACHGLLNACRRGRSLGDMAADDRLAQALASLPSLIEHGWIAGFTHRCPAADADD